MEKIGGAAAEPKARSVSAKALIPAYGLRRAPAPRPRKPRAQVNTVRAPIDRARQSATTPLRGASCRRARSRRSANDMLDQDLDRVADRRHRQPPARARRRDGSHRHPESARHDADDHLRSRCDQRGSESRRSRRAARRRGPGGRWSRSRRCPANSFAGKVVEIGASALPVSGTGAAAREFKVVVRLDQPDRGLRPGLTCDAEIVTSERTNVLTCRCRAWCSGRCRPPANGLASSPGRRPGALHSGLLGRDRRTRHRSERGRRRERGSSSVSTKRCATEGRRRSSERRLPAR